MIQFNEITLNDKELFNNYIWRRSYQASEVNFTNFFMWRRYYNFLYAEILDALCVISVPENAEPFAFLPIGTKSIEHLEECLHIVKAYFSKRKWKMNIKRVAEEDLIELESTKSFKFDITFQRNHSDYVYSSDDLIFLKGKKFDAKRNHINYFLKNYSFEYVPLTNSLIDNCFNILEEWYNNKIEDLSDYYYERDANYELLTNFDKLDCKGALLKTDGKFEAFVVGEKLNSETAVLHIEKANPKIRGLYPFAKREFLKNEFNNISYINFEQDLGIEGLRKSKLSFNPIKMVNKFDVIVV